MSGYCAVCSRTRLHLGPPIQKRATISPLPRPTFITLLRETFGCLFRKKSFVKSFSCVAFLLLSEIISYSYSQVAYLVFTGRSHQVATLSVIRNGRWQCQQSIGFMVILLLLGWWVSFQGPALLTLTLSNSRYSTETTFILTYQLWGKHFFLLLSFLVLFILASGRCCTNLSAIVCSRLFLAWPGEISQWTGDIN